MLSRSLATCSLPRFILQTRACTLSIVRRFHTTFHLESAENANKAQSQADRETRKL